MLMEIFLFLLLVYIEKIRTDFINGRSWRNSLRPTFRPPRQKAEAERQTAKEPEKMSARTLFWPEAGLSLFSLLDFNLFVIIILKVEIVNTTITYYQIIENMARENNIGENIKKYRTKQGLSQEDFAKKSGVKYTTLTKIESGVIKKTISFSNGKNRQGVRC